ncbi:MAG: hypothetical protein QF704_10455 [Anaerolineales bacterium]|jgi:hypothetical protein|nr:hypothetical protein [Anaerolineales bacterium]
MLDFSLYAGAALGFGFSIGFVADAYRSMTGMMLTFGKRLG